MDKPSPAATPERAARTPTAEHQQRLATHWKATRRLTVILLTIWLLTGFLTVFFARELLQFLPLPVIGLDDEGMIPFINAAAANLFERGAALLGNEAALVLPQLFDGQDTPRLAAIDGQPYVVAIHPMGLHSRSRGSLVTLSRHGADK